MSELSENESTKCESTWNMRLDPEDNKTMRWRKMEDGEHDASLSHAALYLRCC